ncbi:hypothetical protein RND81_01G161800 [Saponaria officinalis]|uniref:VQ domain-containing protein n=1 Tax=Saponaria officinalis TaxID=3572 RepID=A0AAW1NGC6_SAPOF
MDNNYPSDGSGGGNSRLPSRKELQGPRPAPLKVRKESHKIRKPPVAPPGVPPQQPPPPQQPRQPVIIYTVSPKVIHANPNEFMTLVQRLTGPDATSSSTVTCESSTTTSSSSSMAHHYVSGAISPAARFASIEMTKMPLGSSVDENEGVLERSRVFLPSILSPGPSSLPPISPNLFSPFFNDPNFGINNNYNYNFNNNINNNYMHSPFSTNNFISPGALISPTSLDLLHQILNS